MCLTIDTRVHKPPKVEYKPLTAKQDITTYKIVLRERFYNRKSKKKRVFEAAVRSFKYELRKRYEAKFSFGVFGDNRQVNSGIHSYTKTAIILKTRLGGGYRPGTYNRYEVLECIIPAGAKYYVGESGDMVSTALITKRVINVNKHPDFIIKKKSDKK